MQAHHTIVLDTGNARDASYGIKYRGRNVYSTRKSHSPTRLVVWDNTGRPNPDLGKGLGDKLRNGNVLTTYTVGQGHGTRRYIDPQGNPSDEPITILLTPESSVICADTRMNTGQPGSGQVYAPGVLADGDSATLVYPSGTRREVILHFPAHTNGHGYAKFAD
jgi:hypothetical protein